MKTKIMIATLLAVSAVSVSASPKDYKVVSYTTVDHANYPFFTCNIVVENKTSHLYAESEYPCGRVSGLAIPVNIGDSAEKVDILLFISSPEEHDGRTFRIRHAEVK